jgi:carboxypeptidase D
MFSQYSRPVGTGFSQGIPTATSEDDVAAQFLGFWKNFVDTFDLHGKKVYIAGESYAGYYVPYIADAMFNKEDKKYYNMDSILIYDPSLTYNAIQEQIPAVPFVNYWGLLLDLNETFVKNITARAKSCGYTDYLHKYLTFPPKGPLPLPPHYNGTDDAPECDIWDDVFSAASLINPCFDIYQVATTCPLLWDVLGFPGSFDYVPEGASIYFNRTEVQKAINAPQVEWAECTSVDVFVNGTDKSSPSARSVLPSVIERTNRTIIGHGLLDFILMYNGTLLAIQNMTWGGKQGFQKGPAHFDDFYVPYHNELNLGSIAGSGIMGKTHTERGLTLVTVTLSGHMVPQYAPSAGYRHVEFLLGRIDSLSEVSPFTTQPKVGQPPEL